MKTEVRKWERVKIGTTHVLKPLIFLPSSSNSPGFLLEALSSSVAAGDRLGGASDEETCTDNRKGH